MLQNDGKRGIGFFLSLESPVESYFQVHAVFSAIRKGQPAFSKYRQEPFIFGSDRLKIRGLHNFMDHHTIDQYLVCDRSGSTLQRQLVLSIQLSEPSKFQVLGSHERSKWMVSTGSSYDQHRIGSDELMLSRQLLALEKAPGLPSNSTACSRTSSEPSTLTEDKDLGYAMSTSTCATLSTNAMTDHSEVPSRMQRRLQKDDDLRVQAESFSLSSSHSKLPQSSIAHANQKNICSPGRRHSDKRSLHIRNLDNNYFHSHRSPRLMNYPNVDEG